MKKGSALFARGWSLTVSSQVNRRSQRIRLAASDRNSSLAS